jgi:hypothetical protein
MEQRREKKGSPTRGFVFRVCFDCAFSSSDSDALERRLGSGLLLRHPQVSNQNSKERTTINPTRSGRAPRLENITLDSPSFLFWSTLPFPSPSLPLSNPSHSVLFHSSSPSNRHHPTSTEQRALLIRAVHKTGFARIINHTVIAN